MNTYPNFSSMMMHRIMSYYKRTNGFAPFVPSHPVLMIQPSSSPTKLANNFPMV